ncbi:MAG: hypothetical protein P1U64_09045 [Alcanivoracaceae bacterium]|nr:hypothetical protein [Alcanivoracaceae bacterium]
MIPKFDHRLKVSAVTSIDEVMSWNMTGDVEIELTKSSSFEFGIEMFALARLASARNDDLNINVYASFNEPNDFEDLENCIFSTAFGFSLARVSSSVRFNGALASKDFKPLLSSYYRSHRGVVGIGKKLSIVSIDPVYPVPEIFSPQEFDGALPIPGPSSFKKALSEQSRKMGVSDGFFSLNEKGLTQFLYETFRNSCEHGWSASDGFQRSTRSVTIEKLNVRKPDDIPKSSSHDLASYLGRVLVSEKDHFDSGFLCISVADQGLGIQKTLPEYSGESPQKRFIRAFKDGESRKPDGVVQRGLGLGNAISAAMALDAYVRIFAGGFFYEQDFSKDDQKYPSLNGSLLREIDSSLHGTVFSIIFPRSGFSSVQAGLF